MSRSSALERSLAMLRFALRVAHAGDEYAIFGSASLRLRGIIGREPGDLDVFVSRRVWGAILPRRGWHVETPSAGDPPILTFAELPVPLHLFFDWRDDAVEINVAAALAGGDLVDGFRCCAVAEVLRHKRAAFVWGTPGTAKHGPDIEAIEAWLGSC